MNSFSFVAHTPRVSGPCPRAPRPLKLRATLKAFICRLRTSDTGPRTPEIFLCVYGQDEDVTGTGIGIGSVLVLMLPLGCGELQLNLHLYDGFCFCCKPWLMPRVKYLGVGNIYHCYGPPPPPPPPTQAPTRSPTGNAQ